MREAPKLLRSSPQPTWGNYSASLPLPHGDVEGDTDCFHAGCVAAHVQFAESTESRSFGGSFYAPVQGTQEMHTGAQTSQGASSCSGTGGHASTRLIRDKLSATRCHVRSIKYEAITHHCARETLPSPHDDKKKKKKTIEIPFMPYLFLV